MLGPQKELSVAKRRLTCRINMLLVLAWTLRSNVKRLALTFRYEGLTLYGDRRNSLILNHRIGSEGFSPKLEAAQIEAVDQTGHQSTRMPCEVGGLVILFFMRGR
jgi:hypothetical protein